MNNLPAHVPLVAATRGGIVESLHYGSIAVAGPDGRLLHAIGDVAHPVFARSSLKPFQALPFVGAGGPAHFGFSAQQLALICASHSGDALQVSHVADMLGRIGCSEADLQCGTHEPLFFAAEGIPVPPGFAPTPLQHNCSGKHAGFLAWCRLHDAPPEHYLDPDHPLQRAIRQCVGRVSSCDDAALVAGIDGCSAPNYALPLARLAHAYARLAAERGDAADAPALAAIFAAMTAHPEMVAGRGRVDLALMRAGRGDWVAKGGAEGVQALGVASRGIGIALKVADGGIRALKVATATVLHQLGLMRPDGPLAAWRDDEIRNAAGRTTGRLVPLFRLD